MWENTRSVSTSVETGLWLQLSVLLQTSDYVSDSFLIHQAVHVLTLFYFRVTYYFWGDGKDLKIGGTVILRWY